MDTDLESIISETSDTSGRANKIVEEVVDTSPEILVPEYTDTEVDKLIGDIKKMTVLFYLRDQDWNDENCAVIKTWLFNVNELMLTIYYHGNDLTASLKFPTTPVYDLMYFLREPHQIFTVDGFHDEIFFGTLHEDVEASLITVLENVYGPIFFNNKEWSQNVKGHLCSAIHSVLSFLTGIHYKICGLCVLYIPFEGANMTVEDAAMDRELLKRLETVISFWMSQIQLCLNDTKQLVPYDLVCPPDEYDFWSYRYEALCGLHHQLKHKDVSRIIEILEIAQSSYLSKILKLIDETDEEMLRAKSNLAFLEILVEPCLQLEKSKLPSDVPPQLVKIMHLIRVIWKNSKYYNTKELITGLFRTLSNLVIIFCREKVNVGNVLAGSPRIGIEMANMSIDCCLAYKEIYAKIQEYHCARDPQIGWDLNYPNIFNQIDAFVKRLYDLIEICEAMIVFGRHDEREKIPKPLFGGVRGKDFQKICDQIEINFNEGLYQMRKISTIILQVHNNSWYDEITKFRSLLRDLEEVVENLMSNVFLNVGNIEEELEALYSLKNFTYRRNLLVSYIKRTTNMWNNFSEEIAQTNREILNRVNERPAFVPDYSGKALMLRIKIDRLDRLKNLLEQAEWLPPNPNSYNVLAVFDTMKFNIEKNIVKISEDWLDMLGNNISAKLDRPLMCRSVLQRGLLECNIDRIVPQLLEDARYFELLGIPLPAGVNQIYMKATSLNFMFESVITVALDYNKILSALSNKERVLFKALIQNCERKITPGIYKLTWGAEFSDQYIAECAKNTSKLQSFVDIFKMANLSVVKTCEQICDTLILEIENDGPVEMDELEEGMESVRNENLKQLLQLYRNIVDYIVIVYKGFEDEMDNMAGEWLSYIQRFDDLLQESFKMCVKGTLTSIHKALQGDGTMSPLPLILVEIDLVENELTFTPSMQSIANLFGNIFKTIVMTVKHFPRLCEKFKIPWRRGALPFHEFINRDRDCKRLNKTILEEIQRQQEHMHSFSDIWSPFESQWKLDKTMTMRKFDESQPNADDFDINIGRFTEVANKVSMQESISNVHFVIVNSMPLKNSILSHIDDWQKQHTEMLKQKAYDKITRLYDYTKMHAEKILVEPTDIVSMQNMISYHNLLKDEIPIREAEFPSIRDYFNVINKYELPISSGIRQMENNMMEQWRWYLAKLLEAEDIIDVSKDQFKMTLLEEAKELKKEAKKLLETFGEKAPFSSALNPEDALGVLQDLRNQLQAQLDREAQLTADLKVFGINQPPSLDLQKMLAELNVLEEIWEIARQWQSAWLEYKFGKFWDIAIDSMESNAVDLFRTLTRMCKQLKDKNYEILETTRRQVDEFRKTLPLIIALKNPSMRKRHWDRVRTLIEVEFDELSEDFTLEKIVLLNFQKYANEIVDLSNAATMEFQIENNIKNIRQTCETATIEFQPFRSNIYRIKSVDDCFKVLEENAVSISAMKSTRFVEPFIKEVDYWEKTVSYIMETLENTLLVQRNWIYLDNIFSGEDIRRQLPTETQKFDDLCEEWSEITMNMFNEKTGLKATHYQPPNYLLNKLLSMTENLELIQRQLEIYLESKRQSFPRFYFISNDDLLEILGNSKKPETIQSHMKKMFDNLNKLKIHRNINLKTPRWEAHGMYSDDGEYVPFNAPIILDGAAEKWLGQIEVAMRRSLYEQLKATRQSMKKIDGSVRRDKWLELWPGQLCLTSAKIHWTNECTRALIHCRILEERKPLRRLRKKQNSILDKLSELSRRELGRQLRLKVNSLITIEIHGRDVIDKMYKKNCRDVSDFEWFSQLRYRWDREHNNCLIRQTNTQNWYGYEYTGNSGRLVITPLTDRCYITLTTALHLFLGGSPTGPAGTGKTETVKDLGKALGMWAIVNNCSEGLDFKSMGKCFSGLVQTGCWGCFDEFNRINIEVLSVVAQQILSILSAIAQNRDIMMFEGQEIKIIPTVGLFITMNPGYAGRTELPDNLKSMFRPISMVVPDNAIIAENLLFSDGFRATKLLAKKVCVLYELAQQQLSKQNHYDFGLRSMVALLRYAGRKRRQYSQINEEGIVYLAMKDMNNTKLTADDLPLFNEIMSDIFPGVTVPTVDYKEFSELIEAEMKDGNYEMTPNAVRKVIELYETKVSRHSVMILGDTGTAKSVTWKILKGTYCRMKQLGKSGWQDVQEHVLNPKALNLAELYGEFNLSTGEWFDGVLSSIMRRICSDESPDLKWMVFDGPVDAVWIENMNSVMDDNKILTLVNSERITMPEQVSLLFEVGDLAVASPATVSRCGMVYNDYKDWGWWPYVNSWLRTLENQDFAEKLRECFDFFIDAILEVKRKCFEIVPTNELNLIMSCCNLLNAFGTKANGINSDDEEILEKMTKMWFLFAMVWSVCVTVDETGRNTFDAVIREIDNSFPLKDTVYDYFVDTEHQQFSLWSEKLSESWAIPKDLPFYKIIVPTIDTIRYDFVISHLISQKNPVLLVGPVGTGKTSSALSILASVDQKKFSQLTINMSAQTSSKNIQETIESRTEKRTKELYVPIGGKTMICFMDDFNMPAKETYGAQPPLELIRQWIDYGFWYDRATQNKIFVKNMIVMAAMGPPGGGRQVISSRTLSRYNLINMTFPSDSTITRIFGSMLKQQFNDFTDQVKIIGKAITSATIDLYYKVSSKMLPTPSKMHYLFNLRDISKVFQGLLRTQSDYHNTKLVALKLWMHECFRVFYDRLTDEKDQVEFTEIMTFTLGYHFEMTINSLCPNKELPVFGDFISSHGIYEDLVDFGQLKNYIGIQLDDYNNSPNVLIMNLVLFKEAIEHIVRIVRVISQPRGNMLLIGIGGSGRQSLSRIAAYMCEMNIFQIDVPKNYGVVEFREDLKLLYYACGVENKTTLFLMNDTQVVEESFMEILNCMLSTGEVSNLYKPDEFDEIKKNLSKEAEKNGILTTTEALYSFFMERIRSNLHIILCVSPVGDDFRTRIRQYPALVNCTTIDCFIEWSQHALLEVAHKYLTKCELDVTIGEAKVENRRESLVQTTESKLRQGVAEVMSQIHKSVSKMSQRMLAEMKRHNYVTPINYLELVSGYQNMLVMKREEISSSSNKLRNGLAKIATTREKVDVMAEELAISKDKVIEFQVEVDQLIVVIQQETSIADAKKREVATASAKIQIEEEEIKVLADAAQIDLNKAMPALDAATKALDLLDKKDLTEVRSYGRPPVKVERVMSAVMILLRREATWAEAKKALGEAKFLEDLVNFDKDHISEKTLKKIATYTRDPELEPDKVGMVSFACKSLILWVRAIERYGKIYKIVGPKKEKLEETLESLRVKQESLRDMKEQLAILNRRLRELKQDYDEKQKQKEELNKRAETLRLQLERAHALVDGLAGERLRWIERVKVLDEEFNLLVGNCLLSIGFISYLGPFITKYRLELMTKWQVDVKKNGIPCSVDFNFIEFMADPNTIQDWTMKGLPSDTFSIENGITATNAARWPLIIDPQGQAHNWIVRLVKDLKIIDLKQHDFIRSIDMAIRFGHTILLHNVLDWLDPILTPVLSRSIVQQGGQNLIKFNDTFITYHENFQLYITTKLPNPHYPPEISTKTTIINFAVKEEGLQAQLLGIIVRKEKPSLEEQKITLVMNIAQNKKILVNLENEILRLLNESRGSLLEDDDLFDTLQTSKRTSAIVLDSLAVAEETEIEIDTVRNGYQSAAHRASILFFILMDMANIDPMYQFSLDAYILLFNQSIDQSPKNTDLIERIQSLNNYHTLSVYRNTCRGLFEKHKLLFSLHMCAKILDADGQLNNAEYEFLLRGGIVVNRQEQVVNPCTSWISEAAWDNITELDKVPGYHGLVESIEQSDREWREWYSTSDPENHELVGEWEKMTSFQKMMIIRCLRPDRMTTCIISFISKTLGHQFVEPPNLDIQKVFNESLPQSPLIFVLSSGVDPTSILVQLAMDNKMSDRFKSLSLGQGQAPIATEMINQGVQFGHWVFLANCHLSLSWMPDLDKIIEELQSTKLHKKFRLWLSSSPHPEFPISILQAGIKMTTEPPTGLKANLKRLYNLVTEEQFEGCQAKEKYKKLLYSLCYFHTLLLERKKFQNLGWNIIYGFNDSDFKISHTILSLYLDEYPETPWDALKYLIADVNYGGHVTDDWDRRLLKTYVNQSFNDNCLKLPFYKLSSLLTYYIPKDGNLQSYITHISLLPTVDRPEAFGQHPNADISAQISESRQLFETLLSLQEQKSSGDGETKESKVDALVSDILSKVPALIDYEYTCKIIGKNMTPLNVVLLQEILRYNDLLIRIKSGLIDIQKGIKGLVVMSAEHEDIFNSLYDGKVPNTWLNTYKSLKSLGSWFHDLISRMDVFTSWSKSLTPPLFFWLGAFTYPTAFLAAVLQNHARSINQPIDTLTWEYFVFGDDEEQQIFEQPSEGIYVRGLYLEGAGWDSKFQCLKDPQPMELITPMPIIHFSPAVMQQKRSRGLYQCPAYYLSQRSGTFIVVVDLKSGSETSDFWIKRGTALLLCLAN